MNLKIFAKSSENFYKRFEKLLIYFEKIISQCKFIQSETDDDDFFLIIAVFQTNFLLFLFLYLNLNLEWKVLQK